MIRLLTIGLIFLSACGGGDGAPSIQHRVEYKIIEHVNESSRESRFSKGSAFNTSSHLDIEIDYSYHQNEISILAESEEVDSVELIGEYEAFDTYLVWHPEVSQSCQESGCFTIYDELVIIDNFDWISN